MWEPCTPSEPPEQSPRSTLPEEAADDLLVTLEEALSIPPLQSTCGALAYVRSSRLPRDDDRAIEKLWVDFVQLCLASGRSAR